MFYLLWEKFECQDFSQSRIISESSFFFEIKKIFQEPAYYYGMAMLEQVRAQQGVFGDGVGDEKGNFNYSFKFHYTGLLRKN